MSSDVDASMRLDGRLGRLGVGGGRVSRRQAEQLAARNRSKASRRARQQLHQSPACCTPLVAGAPYCDCDYSARARAAEVLTVDDQLHCTAAGRATCCLALEPPIHPIPYLTQPLRPPPLVARASRDTEQPPFTCTPTAHPLHPLHPLRALHTHTHRTPSRRLLLMITRPRS
jgi:hypothetical protein